MSSFALRKHGSFSLGGLRRPNPESDSKKKDRESKKLPVTKSSRLGHSPAERLNPNPLATSPSNNVRPKVPLPLSTAEPLPLPTTVPTKRSPLKLSAESV